MTTRPKVFFRVDGHYNYGMGHFFRCLALADHLREKLSFEPYFLVLRSSPHSRFIDFIQRHALNVIPVSGADDHVEDISITKQAVRSLQPEIIITDLLEPDSSDSDLLAHPSLKFPPLAPYIEELKALGTPVSAITDRADRVEMRPHILVAPHPAQLAIEYEVMEETQFLRGPEYFVLCADFQPYIQRERSIRQHVRNIVLTFGGSDHDLYSIKAAQALADLGGVNISVVLGPAFRDAEQASALLQDLGCEVYHNVPNLAELVAQADIVLATAGNTLFELAASGIPSIVVCARVRQFKNAEYFDREGTTINLGMGSRVTAEDFLTTTLDLIDDVDRRREMSRRGPEVVDGRGAQRIAIAISTCIG